jgi:hypothetical protein
LEEFVAVMLFLTQPFLLLYGFPQADCFVVLLFQVFPSVHQGVIIQVLGEVRVFGSVGKHELFPVHLFCRVPGDDWCPFHLSEGVQMACDIASVEFHAGEIFHLVCYEKVEVRVAGDTGIENQDAACLQSWFDLLVSDFEVLLIIDIPGLYAETNRNL